MQFGDITGHIDLAQLTLYLFWAFFFGLVWYLQRESRREGFPLVSDPDGKPLDQDIWIPEPKTFLTNDGRTILAPNPSGADTRELDAQWVVGGPGSPIIPNGDPMKAGVGAGAYAARADVVDYTFDMRPRVVPMRVETEFEISPRDIDPRGVTLFGADDVEAGVVKDVWVDRSDFVIRYLELELAGSTSASSAPTEGGEGAEAGAATAGAGRTVLVPWPMVDITTDRDWFMDFIKMKSRKPNAKLHVRSILAEQFADVPRTQSPDQITYDEEERIVAYYGGGYLYATPDRQEPLV